MTLRTAIAKIDETVDGRDLSDIYQKAIGRIKQDIEPIHLIKISPYVQLNLSEYTKNHDNFRICSICGLLPVVSTPDRLCPYCKTKNEMRNLRIFQSMLETLLDKKKTLDKKKLNGYLPRFPSSASISSYAFREKVCFDNNLIPPLSSIASPETHGETIYAADRKLLYKYGDDQDKQMFLSMEPEDTIYNNDENKKFWKDKKSYSPNTYYALLKGDGDDVGKIISGEISKLNVFASNEFKKYFSTLFSSYT